MPQIISASLSPNTEADDVLRALSMLCRPWQWKTGASLDKIAKWFANRYSGRKAVFFNSGRSSLLAILESFGIGKNDEVIVQAFTCVAVPNSVLWAGATPVYADIDATYNLDPVDVEKKITPRTRAIIVQHTFGIPADLKQLIILAKKHKCILIEDCAHALGSTYDGAPLGSYGDAAFFSFGRDKSVSSVWGGAAMIDPKYSDAVTRLQTYQEALPMPGVFWILQQIIHPVAFAVILPLYRVGIGKLLLVTLQKLHLLSFPVFAVEKRGEKPRQFPAKYPNAMAYLLMVQLKKVDRYTLQRTGIAKRYVDSLKKSSTTAPVYIPGASYLRFTITVPDPALMRQKAKKYGILLGNWYNNIIDPVGVDLMEIGYQKGSCKNAERFAKTALNLPTRISDNDADRVISFLHKEV